MGHHQRNIYIDTSFNVFINMLTVLSSPKKANLMMSIVNFQCDQIIVCNKMVSLDLDDETVSLLEYEYNKVMICGVNILQDYSQINIYSMYFFVRS